MSVAAYAVIGEKQARTLEPLLATPLTTFELLAAKASVRLCRHRLVTICLLSNWGAGAVRARGGLPGTPVSAVAVTTSCSVRSASLAALQLQSACLRGPMPGGRSRLGR